MAENFVTNHVNYERNCMIDKQKRESSIKAQKQVTVVEDRSDKIECSVISNNHASNAIGNLNDQKARICANNCATKLMLLIFSFCVLVDRFGALPKLNNYQYSCD